jgi:hypothetical protein
MGGRTFELTCCTSGAGSGDRGHRQLRSESRSEEEEEGEGVVVVPREGEPPPDGGSWARLVLRGGVDRTPATTRARFGAWGARPGAQESLIFLVASRREFLVALVLLLSHATTI